MLLIDYCNDIKPVFTEEGKGGWWSFSWVILSRDSVVHAQSPPSNTATVLPGAGTGARRSCQPMGRQLEPALPQRMSGTYRSGYESAQGGSWSPNFRKSTWASSRPSLSLLLILRQRTKGKVSARPGVLRTSCLRASPRPTRPGTCSQPCRQSSSFTLSMVMSTRMKRHRKSTVSPPQINPFLYICIRVHHFSHLFT